MRPPPKANTYRISIFQAALILYAVIYTAAHFSILAYYPLPWFDETYFASIAKNFWELGVFDRSIAVDSAERPEEWMYGPVYFYICSLFFELFGFSLVVYRSVSLVFGILVIGAASLLFHSTSLQKSKLTLVFALAMSCDVMLWQSMHNGRMDTTALAFVLISLLLWFRKAISLKQRFYYSFFSGVWALVSLLTTPRVAFIYLAGGLLLVFRKDSLRNGLVALVPVITGYALWIVYAFGSASEFWNFYQSYSNHFVKIFRTEWHWQIPKQQWLLFSSTIFMCLLALKAVGKRLFSKLCVLSLSAIILFQMLVYETGFYSVFLSPFYYFILFGSYQNITESKISKQY